MAKSPKDYDLEDLIQDFTAEQPSFQRTGIVSLDLLNKGQGLLGGTITNLFSASGFGKSTLCLSTAKSLADNYKLKTLYIASEYNESLVQSLGIFDERYAPYIKVVSATTYAELEKFMWAFLKSDYYLLVLDSITAFCVSEAAAGLTSVEDSKPAIDARIRGQLLKTFAGNLRKHSDKACISLLQMRANFNAGFGQDPTQAEGGLANKFYCRVEATILGQEKITSLMMGGTEPEVIGVRGYLVCPSKNSTATPGRRVPIMTIFGKGTSNVYSCLAYLQWKGCIEQSGSSFKITFKDQEEVVKGRAGRDAWIKEHLSEIKDCIYEDAELYYESMIKSPDVKM